MATYYFRNVGTDWGTASNWSLTDGGGATGAVPTTTDDALFTANSGNCSMNANRVCKSINFTGYANVLDVATYQLQVYGNVTFQANQSSRITGTTGILRIFATSTITSNGGTWPLSFGHAVNNITITLADNMTVSLDLTSAGGNGTYNGFKLYIGRDILSTGTYLGTTDIIMNGTGTCTLPTYINLEVNTAGTITITGTGTINRRFVITAAGTITMTSANISVGYSTATTVDVGGRTIGNFTVPSATSTTTISTDIYCNNYSGGNSTAVNGPGKIYVNGSVSGNLAAGNVAFVCIGSGNIAGNIGGGGLTVNTAGSYTTSGTLIISAPFIIVGTSNISLTGGAFTFSAGATIDVGGRTFGNVVFQSSSGTVTVSTDMYCGNFTGGNGPVINGPGKIYASGTYNGHNGGGNITIELNGSGNFSGTISTNLRINTSGTYTFGSNVNTSNAITITHDQGTINPGTYTFSHNTLNNVTFNINTTGFNLYNWTLPNVGSSQTYTINTGIINILNNLSIVNNNPTFAGTGGWTAANWSETTAGRTVTLTAGNPGNIYTITTSLVLTGTNASPVNIISSSGTLKTTFTLNQGATQTVQFVKATRIDSSGGQTIWDTVGTIVSPLTSTINWNSGTRPAPFNTIKIR